MGAGLWFGSVLFVPALSGAQFPAVAVGLPNASAASEGSRIAFHRLLGTRNLRRCLSCPLSSCRPPWLVLTWFSPVSSVTPALGSCGDIFLQMRYTVSLGGWGGLC